MVSLLPTTMLSVRMLSTTDQSTLDASAAQPDMMEFLALVSTLAIVDTAIEDMGNMVEMADVETIMVTKGIEVTNKYF